MHKLIKEYSQKEFIDYAEKIVKEHKEHVAPKMKDAEAYYKGNNTAILERKKLMAKPSMDSDGNVKSYVAMNDPYRANNTLASNYFRPIVKQKVATLINSYMTISDERVKETLGKRFVHRLKTLGEEASQKVYGAWQVFIQDGEFKLKQIKSENTIFIDDEIDEDVYHIVLRYFVEKVNHKEVLVIHAYDAERKIIIKDGKIVQDTPHGVTAKVFDNGDKELGEPVNWGMPPFVRLRNNHEMISDLQPIKGMIDIYDVVNSDFANNLEDFQEMFWVLKNFDGQNIDEYFDQVKRLKAIKVGEQGDAKLESQEVPVEARKEFLDLTEQNIYKFAMAVNTNNATMGDLTNVVLKSLYTNLNLKVDDFESEVEVTLDILMTLLNKYYEMTSQATIDAIEFNFDRSMVFNEVELSTLANESVGALSEETRLSNDPRVRDVKKEMEQMKADKEANMDLIGGDMGFNPNETASQLLDILKNEGVKGETNE